MAQTRCAFERYHVRSGAEPWLRGIERKTAASDHAVAGRHVRSMEARGLALVALGSLLAGTFIRSRWANWDRASCLRQLAASPDRPRSRASWLGAPILPGYRRPEDLSDTLVLQDQKGRLFRIRGGRRLLDVLARGSAGSPWPGATSRGSTGSDAHPERPAWRQSEPTGSSSRHRSTARSSPPGGTGRRGSPEIRALGAN